MELQLVMVLQFGKLGDRIQSDCSTAGWQMSQTDSPSVDDLLFDAARAGDVGSISALLEKHPEKLEARDQPYEHTLLHAAASTGQLPVVDLLLARGIDANVREKGDNTYPMHWASAGGY